MLLEIKRKTTEGLSVDEDTNSQALGQDLESVSSYQTSNLLMPTLSLQNTNSFPANQSYQQNASYPSTNMMPTPTTQDRNDIYLEKTPTELTSYSEVR